MPRPAAIYLGFHVHEPSHQCVRPSRPRQRGAATRSATGGPRASPSWKELGAFRQKASRAAFLLRSAGPWNHENFSPQVFFKDAWVERKFPRRAVAAAALWHLVLIALPTPDISGPRHNAALDNTVLTWSGPIEDLPMLKRTAITEAHATDEPESRCRQKAPMRFIRARNFHGPGASHASETNSDKSASAAESAEAPTELAEYGGNCAERDAHAATSLKSASAC